MAFKKENRDKVHNPILDRLNDLNIWYEDMAAAGEGFPDIVTGRYPDKILFMEAKSDMRYSQISSPQLVFIANTPAFYVIVTTPDEAVEAVSNPEKYALTQKEKDRVAAWLETVGARLWENKKGKEKRVQLLYFWTQIIKRKTVPGKYEVKKKKGV